MGGGDEPCDVPAVLAGATRAVGHTAAKAATLAGMFAMLQSALNSVVLLWFWLTFGVYVVHHLIVAYFFKTQNLRRKYNAEWALVTGSSSGGRRAIRDLDQNYGSLPAPWGCAACPPYPHCRQRTVAPAPARRHRQVARVQTREAGPERGAGGAAR